RLLSTATMTAAAAVDPELVASSAMLPLHRVPHPFPTRRSSDLLSSAVPLPPASAGAAKARHNANAATAYPRRFLGISISLFPLVKFKNDPRRAGGGRRPPAITRSEAVAGCAALHPLYELDHLVSPKT